MKICYIADAGSIHTRKWVGFFAEAGHGVHLISPPSLEDNNPSDVNLYPLKVLRGVRGLNHLFCMTQIKRIIHRIKPDILHAHYVADYGFWGALCGFHPFVVTAWGSDILVRPQVSKLSKWMVMYVLKQADLITCDAEHLARRIVELGVDKGKIKLIYFGVDTEKFNPNKRDLGLKQELQLGSNSPTIISLRSLSSIYDVESLIRAIPLVLSNIPDATFVIVGDGEQRNYLENLAISLGVRDSIRFTGRIRNDKLPGYIASSDIYVSTSLSDAGLAASTAEAMACELPVVITDFGNNRDWVKDGEGGFIVPTKNPAVLAEKIVFLIRNKSLRRKFGRINRRVIEEKNNYKKEMKSMEEIYFQLVTTRLIKR